MLSKSNKAIRIICGTLLVALFAFIAYLCFVPGAFKELYLKASYQNVRSLDEQKRCMVFELKDKQNETSVPALKFYDMKLGKLVHLDPTRTITEVKEIRPGYYALFNRAGLQAYSLVMPYSAEDTYYDLSDEIQIIDCIPDDWYKQGDDSNVPKLPSNIYEAETQLIKQFEETEDCGYDLVGYAKEYSATLEYDFDRLKEQTNVSIITSPDRKLRFYTWDTGTGGTSPDFASYVQYENGKSVAISNFSPMTKSKYVCETDVAKDGYQPCGGGWIDCLDQIDQPNGKPMYIAVAYNKASSREGEHNAYIVKIIDGKLQKAPFIDKDGQQVFSVGCYYSIPDWYFTTDGIGGDWVMSFDKNTQTLYVPEDGDMEMSDRYDKYQLVNGQMRYMGKGAGFWLHPSLQDFKRLCGIYQTETKLIRIDLLADGDYRYAAWRKKNDMSKTPELVITGGKTDVIENAIVFEKDGYQYIVPAYRRGVGDDFGKLIVKKNGKVIQETEV